MRPMPCVVLLCLTLACPAVFAQAPAIAPPADVPAPVDASSATSLPKSVPAPCACLPAGTLIELELVDRINSFERKRGDRFALRLAQPVQLDGHDVLPAGLNVVGEVVHAQAASAGGKPGELLLAGRFLEWNGRQVPIRGLKAGASGRNNAGIAMAASFAVGPFAMFIRGREIEIPAGTRMQAKLGENVVPAEPLPDVDPVETTTTQE